MQLDKRVYKRVGGMEDMKEKIDASCPCSARKILRERNAGSRDRGKIPQLWRSWMD